jgi:hypothetical protein
MAKDIKSRACSLDRVLEGIEIKHPLVQLTHLCGFSYLIPFMLVLDASQEPFGDHCFRRSRTFYQRTSRVRKRSGRCATDHEIVTTPRAIFHCHPHFAVRLVSRPTCNLLLPIYDCFSFLVPRILCFSARNSQCATLSPSDTTTIVGIRWRESVQDTSSCNAVRYTESSEPQG